MDPVTTAARTRDAVVDLPAGFMLDAATYRRGGELGYDGIDFYFAGRGGALGDVDGAVVAAAFVFFNPTVVAEAWDRAGKVAGPRDTALAYSACGSEWAEAHLPADVDYDRLAELAGRVVSASSIGGAPLFAAWAAMPEPSSPAALALHRLNLLRELRGARHGGAVLAAGLTPEQALGVKTPFMAALFGWPEPSEPSPEVAAAWEQAEQLTNRAMAAGFDALDESARDELVVLCDAARGA